MYYIYGQSGPSLLIESTDSMIDFKTSRRQLSLEDVQQFLESRCYIEEALDDGSTIDKMTVAIKT